MLITTQFRWILCISGTKKMCETLKMEYSVIQMVDIPNAPKQALRWRHCWCSLEPHLGQPVCSVIGPPWHITVNIIFLFSAGENTDSANKVAEKLEELSVKDKTKTEEKREEGKEKAAAEEKKWNQELALLIFNLSFSTIDSKETEFGHLHIDLFSFF